MGGLASSNMSMDQSSGVNFMQPFMTRTQQALTKAYRSRSIRQAVKEKMEATELQEASDKVDIPVAKMNIWDPRLKNYIRHQKLTVGQVEEEVQNEQLEK
jgi:hypothetical protein